MVSLGLVMEDEPSELSCIKSLWYNQKTPNTPRKGSECPYRVTGAFCCRVSKMDQFS